MDKRPWIFICLALATSVGLAVFISPFTSSSPDGLEKVAEDKGSLVKAEEEQPTWEHSPMPDYTVGGMRSTSLATAAAGLIGTALTFTVGLGLARVIAGKKKSKETLQES